MAAHTASISVGWAVITITKQGSQHRGAAGNIGEALPVSVFCAWERRAQVRGRRSAALHVKSQSKTNEAQPPHTPHTQCHRMGVAEAATEHPHQPASIHPGGNEWAERPSLPLLTTPNTHFPHHQCTEEGQGWGGGGGWRHLRGPDALPPDVCVVGLVRDSSGVGCGAPA